MDEAANAFSALRAYARDWCSSPSIVIVDFGARHPGTNLPIGASPWFARYIAGMGPCS